MKRLFLLLFLSGVIFISSYIFAPSVLGGSVAEIPGVTCGMAGAENGADKCCYLEPKGLPNLPGKSIIDKGSILLGGPFGEYKKTSSNIEEFQGKYSSTLPCWYGQRDPPDADPSVPGSCTCKLSVGTTTIPNVSKLCEKYIDNDNEIRACTNCATGGGYWSGMGCIPLDPQNFVTNYLLVVGIGLGGLVAFLCILYSAFILQTSRGNAEKVQKAREYLTSCIIGLLLIIFSIFILWIVGISIIEFPG